MSTGKVILLVCVFFLVDFVMVGTLIHVCGRSLRKLCSQFPPLPRSADAVERRFQGFKIEMISLGFSVHAAVDENALHLTPTRVARWMGMTPTSLPWTAFKNVRPVMGGVSAEVAGVGITGPKWCMELAGVPATGKPERPRDQA